MKQIIYFLLFISLSGTLVYAQAPSPSWEEQSNQCMSRLFEASKSFRQALVEEATIQGVNAREMGYHEALMDISADRVQSIFMTFCNRLKYK